MNVAQTLPIAMRALLRNKTRSFLTALGVVIGVASVISMVAIGEGAKSSVEKIFASMGTNLLIVLSGSTSSGGVMGGFGSMPTLTWDDLKAIQTEAPAVRSAAPQLNTKASIVGEEANWNTTITGTTPDYFLIRSWKLGHGALLSDSDIETGNKVIVLGQTVSDRLFGANVECVGRALRIRGIPFMVVGVLDRKGQSPMGQDYDDAAFIPVSTFQAKIQGGLQKFLAGAIMVSAVTAEDTARAQKQITGILRDRHHILTAGDDDFNVRNLTEMAQAQQQGTKTLTSLLAGIAIVSLIVGGIGIMNIMLVSVSERTREIGVRMAVGAKPWHILTQFLVEAMTLSVMGGFVGVGLGVVVASTLANQLGWTLVMRPDIIVVSVGFSAIVGVAFGLYPAKKASDLYPIRRPEVRVMRRAVRSVTVVVGFAFGAASASAQPEANPGGQGLPALPALPPAGGPLNPSGTLPPAALPEAAPPLSPRPPPEQTLAPTSASGRILTLAEAEASALAHQPQIMQAKAQTRAFDAKVDEAFAPLLPQVQGLASYGRRTGNFVPQAGAVPNANRGPTRSSFDTFDSFNFSLTATQLIYDFGQKSGGYHVAQANAEAQKINEATVRLSVLLGVRSAYALAWANRALVSVAQETLENSERHLKQIEGLVHAGARPEIDLAQVKADRANANLQLINAENSYATAKAQLNQAMGVEESTDYDIGGETAAPVSGEDLDERRLVGLAVDARPEMKGLEKQSEADARQLSATKGAYGPSLSVQTSLTDGGRDLTALVWNGSATANLAWPLFEGGITNARIREAEANQDVTRSQIALERQQIRFEITQARLSIRGAKAALDASREVELNARERLRLAEARYRAGAGSIIELEDAQIGATTAAGQVVQADYGLAVARAQLAKGLGQR